MWVIHRLLDLYLLLLVARLVIDWVMVFNRSFRPRGPLLPFFELVFTLTDPPLRLLRRFIPPLRVGNVSLDLSFLVLFIGIQVVNSSLP